jgi:altronate hydrolase
MQTAVRIHEMDNVAVALCALPAGQELTIGEVSVWIAEDIPVGHKFALVNLEVGCEVVKYGYSIGKTIRKIGAGEWVHTHNLGTGLGEVLDYSYQPLGTYETTGSDCVDGEKFFEGYRRENGKVGIRNEIFIIPTVGCVNDVARLLEKNCKEFQRDGIDEVVAFTHPYGCSQLGDDQRNTQKILAGLINHPNAGGVLVLGLGCENNSIEEMKKYLGEVNSQRVKFLVCQECEDELEDGKRLLTELMDYASQFRREGIPSKELVVGLKCGGSDGLSGITANPTVGAFSDLLIAKGGATILTEVPEMFGAETILMSRCVNQEVFDQTVGLINEYKNYYKQHNQPIYENPSPGNKKGGISTLEDKSLGCTQKSGFSQVTGVLGYGEVVSGKGLMLLSSPGNDLVAATALAASGAHIILFTTGRGTPFGAPVPTVKISSNSNLAARKKDWIDFDAGRLLEGGSKEELSEELFELVLEVASGRRVKSEEFGYHDLAILKTGVTL